MAEIFHCGEQRNSLRHMHTQTLEHITSFLSNWEYDDSASHQCLSLHVLWWGSPFIQIIERLILHINSIGSRTWTGFSMKDCNICSQMLITVILVGWLDCHSFFLSVLALIYIDIQWINLIHIILDYYIIFFLKLNSFTNKLSYNLITCHIY